MRLVWVVALVVGGLAGCRDAETGTGAVLADTGATAVIALQGDLDYANILSTGDRLTQEVLRYALFLPLVHYSKTLDYEPALAESWTFEGDSAVTFKLRRDVRWHDGKPSSAHDVAFTFERAADTATAFPNADWLVGWGAPQVIDSFTVRFALERMADPLASVALFPIMPRHLLEAIPAAELRQAPFNKKPVGNGPFRFVEYHANDRWILEANPDFPEGLGGRPPLGRLVLRILPDPTSQVAELKAGNVDLALNTPIDQYRQLDTDTLLRGITRDSRQYAFVVWNSKRPRLADPRVRRALTMAMNRTEMIGVARAGQGVPAVSPVGSYHWAFDSTLQAVPYSPDSARALLAEAGVAESSLAIELKVPSQSTAMRTMAQLIQSDLGKIGVQVSLRPIDNSVLVADLTDPKRNFDAAIMGWENDIRLNFRDMFHSAAINDPFQFGSYSNPAIDSIIDQASSEPDRAKARPLWLRFQSIMRAEQPWTILFHFPDLYMSRERLQGVEMDVRGALVNVKDWWVRRNVSEDARKN